MATLSAGAPRQFVAYLRVSAESQGRGPGWADLGQGWFASVRDAGLPDPLVQLSTGQPLDGLQWRQPILFNGQSYPLNPVKCAKSEAVLWRHRKQIED